MILRMCVFLFASAFLIGCGGGGGTEASDSGGSQSNTGQSQSDDQPNADDQAQSNEQPQSNDSQDVPDSSVAAALASGDMDDLPSDIALTYNALISFL